MTESDPFPSRLERFQKKFPEHEKRIKALRRLVGKIPDSIRDETGQRTRYRPLFEKETRRVLRNRERNGDAEVARRMQEQEASLNEWISCLDEEYSGKEFTWPIHQIIAPQILGSRDSIGDQPFERRTPETYAPYPRLNREALARVMDMLLDASRKDVRPTDFLSMYQTELHVVEARARENAAKNFENIPHVWKTYEGEKGARELVKDLADKGTGWCIAGYAQAYGTYLSQKGSHMHVCFRGDKDAGSAIYTVNGAINQIRGSAPGQHMDGDAAQRAKAYIRENLSKENSLESLDEKFADVMTLTEILDGALESRDRNQREHLLRFLYEIDRPIQSFGYGRDSRIDALRKKRDGLKMKDAEIIFGKERIATRPAEISTTTEACIAAQGEKVTKQLIGALKTYRIENVYTKFPEGKIQLFPAIKHEDTIGNSPKELRDPKTHNMYVSEYAEFLYNSDDYKKAPEVIDDEYIVLTVREILGEDRNAKNIDEILKKAELLGLERVSAKAGPALRKAYKGTDLLFVGMDPISVSAGDPRVFRLGGYGGRLGLSASSATEGSEWGPSRRFVFRLRKGTLKT